MPTRIERIAKRFIVCWALTLGTVLAIPAPSLAETGDSTGIFQRGRVARETGDNTGIFQRGRVERARFHPPPLLGCVDSPTDARCLRQVTAPPFSGHESRLKRSSIRLFLAVISLLSSRFT